MTGTNDVSNVAFHITGGMFIEKWLNYFYNDFTQKKYDDEWKIVNIYSIVKVLCFNYICQQLLQLYKV